jgi:hypothetical protein
MNSEERSLNPQERSLNPQKANYYKRLILVTGRLILVYKQLILVTDRFLAFSNGKCTQNTKNQKLKLLLWVSLIVNLLFVLSKIGELIN